VIYGNNNPFLWEEKMEEDKKTYKYMTMFSVIIAVVVVAQIILANYLQSIY
tara:strand:+ start:2000 stop:2152 length:153 start_codon:yes stop_codon:yes gene_type:complete